ncbi:MULTISPECIES: WXG100 family type VII secretion target [Rhodococcus]|uniref:WXG100 family type VII secretion target n=1 Tax=Rhodococcus cerastii TaxID=908616 RepID=A0ABU4D740_9NOCA|nr:MULTISPECIES: WXG100 family type VII secretion target [Rhodococcus]MDV6305216.1 WXG100 family type VII secretion target [Rhodococcus cerastii]MDV8058107.1 WXG100 family type VII secretion target [Rhodococcus sp. IEGM 1343]
MGSEPLSVVLGELRGLCRSTYRVADELARALSSVQPDVERVADGWVGASGSAFDAHWEELCSRARVVTQELASIAVDLEQAAREYVDADDVIELRVSVLDLD